MDIRKVKEAFGKAKINASRGEYTTSLQFFNVGLREVLTSSGLPLIEVRSYIREIVQLYATAPPIRNLLNRSMSYTPGNEKALYTLTRKVYNVLANKVEPEKYEDAIARKKKLDKYLILGKKYLQEGKLSEADQMLQGAAECYRDEKILFSYIAKLYMDAHQDARAITFWQKALEVDPKNDEIQKTLLELLRKRD